MDSILLRVRLNNSKENNRKKSAEIENANHCLESTDFMLSDAIPANLDDAILG